MQKNRDLSHRNAGRRFHRENLLDLDCYEGWLAPRVLDFDPAATGHLNLGRSLFFDCLPLAAAKSRLNPIDPRCGSKFSERTPISA